MIATAKDLGEAIVVEIQRVKDNVQSWGLSPTGIDRMLFLVNEVDKATVQDLITHSAGVVDVTSTLAERLELLRDLKKAVDLNFQQARDAAWAADLFEGGTRRLFLGAQEQSQATYQRKTTPN